MESGRTTCAILEMSRDIRYHNRENLKSPFHWLHQLRAMFLVLLSAFIGVFTSFGLTVQRRRRSATRRSRLRRELLRNFSNNVSIIIYLANKFYLRKTHNPVNDDRCWFLARIKVIYLLVLLSSMNKHEWINRVNVTYVTYVCIFIDSFIVQF